MNTKLVLFGHTELRETLQGALGEERAELAITTAAEALGCLGAEYASDDALSILGLIAEHDGLVGICARFARSRVLSRMAANSLAAHVAGPMASG